MSFAKFTLAVLVIVVGVVSVFSAVAAQGQTETVLYTFCASGFGCSDGAIPNSPLTPDGKGNFYGATVTGGTGPDECCGTVFELSPNGSGGWIETVLYSFTGYEGLSYPTGSLVFDSAGNLYGTAEGNGAHGWGAVFKLSPGSVGASWTETTLYSFAGGTDGANPSSGVVIDAAGNLYGTTGAGGSGGSGTVFELSPSGGGWTEQVIYNTDTSWYAGLTMDSGGSIFGVSQSQVFELQTNGSGRWNPIVLHTFNANKSGRKLRTAPNGTLAFDKAGNIFGTNTGGGAYKRGAVFELTPGKNGKYKERTLYDFGSMPGDGAYPLAGVVLDGAGNVYGATTEGGINNSGAVFELVAPVGKGSYQGKTLWSFNGTDGDSPEYSLIMDSVGNLYGTTTYGDGNPDGACYGLGCGMAFEITP